MWSRRKASLEVSFRDSLPSQLSTKCRLLLPPSTPPSLLLLLLLLTN